MTERNDRRGRPLLPEVLVVAAMGLVTLAIGTWLSLSLVLSLPLVLLSGTALMLAFLTLHALVRNRACRVAAVAPDGEGHAKESEAIAPAGGADASAAAHSRSFAETGPAFLDVHEQIPEPELRGSHASDDDLVIAPWPAELHSEPMAEPVPRVASDGAAGGPASRSAMGAVPADAAPVSREAPSALAAPPILPRRRDSSERGASSRHRSRLEHRRRSRTGSRTWSRPGERHSDVPTR